MRLARGTPDPLNLFSLRCYPLPPISVYASRRLSARPRGLRTAQKFSRPVFHRVTVAAKRKYHPRALRRLAQYRFIRTDTSRRSASPMDFRPRVERRVGYISPSNWVITLSSLSRSARSSTRILSMNMGPLIFMIEEPRQEQHAPHMF